MANGKDNTSFMSQLMQKKGLTDEEASENKWLAASLYAAGADTVCPVSRWCDLADRFQDRVCDHDVLPRHDAFSRGSEESPARNR
jgi:hypothetical protein